MPNYDTFNSNQWMVFESLSLTARCEVGQRERTPDFTQLYAGNLHYHNFCFLKIKMRFRLNTTFSRKIINNSQLTPNRLPERLSETYMRTWSEITHRKVKNLKEKQSKQPFAFVSILLLFKL